VLLVILGAGASYDSDPERLNADKASLPLAKDLFAERFAGVARKYDAVQGILTDLRRAPNIEEALEQFMRERDAKPHRTRQILGATYYIREVIDKAQANWLDGVRDHVTNYVHLVEQIERWRAESNETVSFVTFNYDTLLEKAVHSIIGQRFASIDDYIENPTPYSVFKLHGSINWWTGITSRDRNLSMTLRDWADRVLEGTMPPVPLGTFLVADAEARSSEAMIPALALPIVTKTDRDFACPPDHLNPLRAWLPKADRVLVIGWRGAEAHFYALWKESYQAGQAAPKRVLLVGTEEGVYATRHNIQTSAHWLPPAVVFKGGFSSLIGSAALAQFLEEPLAA
jgi:hypothetical protein